MLTWDFTGTTGIVLMLCRMAFHLSGNGVGLHLDNSIAKAYLYNLGVSIKSD